MTPDRIRPFRLLAASAGLVLAGATGAATASPVVPALAGVTTVTGTTAAYVDVRLDRPAGLANPAFGRSGATIGGAGRYVGFFLTDRRPDGVRLLGGRAEDSRLGTYLMPLQGLADAPVLRLPAGRYRLYLLADGARATVTLRLTGLSGRTTLAPARRVPFTLATPAPSVFAPGGGNVAVAGVAATLRRPGVAFDFLRTVNSSFQASHTQFCFYEGAPPAAVAYAPGCPRAAVTPVITVVAPGTGRTEGAAFGGSADLPPGTYAQGVNFASVAVAEGFRYTAGFLSYE